MDTAEFDGWLSRIAALTPPQRRQAWQTLALSEASVCDDTETGPPWGVEIACRGAVATPDQPPTVTPLPVTGLLDRHGADVVAELGVTTRFVQNRTLSGTGTVLGNDP